MPRPRWYLQGGVCATAATSLVGLVHPNIHIVWRKKVPGSGPPSHLTVASMGSRFWPEARYQSWSTRSCSWAKKSMAGPERKALCDSFQPQPIHPTMHIIIPKMHIKNAYQTTTLNINAYQLWVWLITITTASLSVHVFHQPYLPNLVKLKESQWSLVKSSRTEKAESRAKAKWKHYKKNIHFQSAFSSEP